MTTIIGTMPVHPGTAGLITNEYLTKHTVAPHQVLVDGHDTHTSD